ncbi:MAG: dockerin type I domain-containing protein [Candidatus Poribacteria bacterium]|nr:dockerin type I domain-containing protein [Candidatus Poribacteria bacterium]
MNASKYSFYMLHLATRVVSFVRLVLLFSWLSIAIFCAKTLSSASAHQPRRPQAFNGALELTRAPRVGKDATLIFSIRSNLLETIHSRIQFRLPQGISSRSPVQFDRVYFSPYAPDQKFSVAFNVKEPGVYPLQASIYAGLANGQTIIEHFYVYLRVASGYAQVSAVPFNQPLDNPILETHAQVRTAPNSAGDVTIRGSVVYFNDNEEAELPVHRPHVALYLDLPDHDDIKIDETVADDRGEFIFENLSHSDINRSSSRNLYVVVKFDNSVLSIGAPQAKVYAFTSETVRNVPDGVTTIHLSLNSQNSNRAVGYIFNTVQLAHGFLLNRLGWERDRPVRVIWPSVENISYYAPDAIEGQVSNETINLAHGDQWTRTIMFHEYAHAVMTAAYGYNYNAVPKGRYRGSHRLETVSDAGFAFNEGWAAFMEAAVDNRALNVTGYLNQSVPNIESNQWWTGHAAGLGSNTKGENVEGTVASILWDIFDTPDSIDHQPRVDDDGISDGTDLLWEILVNDLPQGITDIAIAWRKRGFPMLEPLEEIYIAHHAIFRLNTAPSFQFTSPNADGAVSDETFQITWEASDSDNDDFTVALFYDRNNLPGGSTLIKSGLTQDRSVFTWNTDALLEGSYYLRAIVSDSQNPPTDVYSDGVVIVDHTPLLPPIVTSNTHPDFNRWYASNSPKLELLNSPMVDARQQYSFILNREPATVPDTHPEALSKSNALAFTGLSDGVWWVHVRARDSLGYWTDASHYGFKIDSTPPPTVSNLNLLLNETGNAREITLEWDAVNDTSGISAYHVQIDVDSRDFQSGMLYDETVNGAITRHTFTGEFDTTYYARVKAENQANLPSRNWSSITPGVMLNNASVWDVNRDATIDIFDLVLVAKHFGKASDQITDPYVDVNGDAVVDVEDLVLVANHFKVDANAAPTLTRMMHNASRSNFDAGPPAKSSANGPTYTEMDFNQMGKTLAVLRRQPQLASNARKAIEALIYWVESAKQLSNPNCAFPIVAKTGVLPVYPNPFNPEVWIPYELAAPASVEIEIYTALGQLVSRSNLGLQPAGRYHRRDNAAHWNGRNQAGNLVGSGVYFYVLRVASRNGELNTFVQNLVLLK